MRLHEHGARPFEKTVEAFPAGGRMPHAPGGEPYSVFRLLGPCHDVVVVHDPLLAWSQVVAQDGAAGGESHLPRPGSAQTEEASPRERALQQSQRLRCHAHCRGGRQERAAADEQGLPRRLVDADVARVLRREDGAAGLWAAVALLQEERLPGEGLPKQRGQQAACHLAPDGNARCPRYTRVRLGVHKLPRLELNLESRETTLHHLERH
mmetsp:Transcript_30380/g.81465  ORF Transcript_30380/g.81465 Transcript_30380/m.81465 type:complete len:209 (+) Transcript_30380:223-849(+)